ncbi:MAG: helix-turn-helix transcriptional regulator [Pseudomonadota bacterium]
MRLLNSTRVADEAGLHINQVRRYEAGAGQPTLEGLIKLAQALHVTLDEWVFDESDRGPNDRMKLLFEAVSRLKEDEQSVIRELLEGMIVKYEARRWDAAKK